MRIYNEGAVLLIFSKISEKRLPLLCVLFLCAFFLFGCSTDESKDTTHSSGDDDTNEDEPPPPFVDEPYIELAKISHISRFRSGIGHDYSDDFESCRSMKHYFVPKQGVDHSLVKIFAPVTGAIVRLDDGWAGTQVHIVSDAHPSMTFILFHVNTADLILGDMVNAGEQIGYHTGPETYSDIAIRFSNQDEWRLLSFFDLITDAHFERYKDRGLSSTGETIISQKERDASPLPCDGETFLDSGALENWIYLD